MKNKRTTLQKSIFKKYMIGFIIFQIIFHLSTQVCFKIMKDISAKSLFSADDVYERVDKYGIEDIYLNKELPSDTYIELLDLDYKVITSFNGPNKLGNIYDKKEIKDISNGKIEYLKLFFLRKSQEILIVREQSTGKQTVLFSVFIICFLVFMLLMYIAFFKIMAQKVYSSLEKPLQNLSDGINAFKNKVYSHRISFVANNELDDLKDTFNEMAYALENEMTLRMEAQNINKHLILDITHDLKTPLTNIKGYCELLTDNNGLEDNTKKQYLNIIISNCERTSKLISDLFDLTYCDLKSINLIKQKTDFSEMLRRIFVEYIVIFEDNKNDYEFNIPNDPIWVCLDVKIIERAICNILNNFLKYSGENTKIVVTLREYNDEIELIVEDNGFGISKDNCELVFLPFVTQDDSRNPEIRGTGLGLAIAKKVVEGHGGNIQLISDIDYGCKFIIKMPKE